MIDILKLIKYLLIGSLLVYLGYRICYSYYLQGVIDLLTLQQEYQQPIDYL